jgi:hypothetical protein
MPGYIDPLLAAQVAKATGESVGNNVILEGAAVGSN